MLEKKFIKARDMLRAVTIDPQFSMPERPRFIRELAVIPMVDGLLFDGTDEQQLLRGRAAQRLLPLLLPLLDGTRSLEQVSAALPHIPSEAIRNAVALLYTRGLLEDTAADAGINPATPDQQTLAFFRRHVDVTRVNRSALQAIDRLAQAQVLVCTSSHEPAEVQTHIAALLRQSGVGSVGYFLLGKDAVPKFEERPGGKQVVVMMTGDDRHADLQSLDDECARLNIPWLRGAVYPHLTRAEIGPYFERGETACYSCFASVQDEFPLTTTFDHTWSMHMRFWAGMLVTESIYLLSRIATPVTVPTLARYQLDSWGMRRLHVPKAPHCPNCYPSRTPEVRETGEDFDLTTARTPPPTAVLYEDAVALPSRHLVNPKSHQVHYHTANVEKTHEGKRYVNVEPIVLPGYEELPRLEGHTLEHLPGTDSSRALNGSLDLKSLTSLLLFSGGIRPAGTAPADKLRRWAPTGGNLGSVELYVAAVHVKGLASGIYFYQPLNHSLAGLSHDARPLDVLDFIGQAVPDEDIDAAAALIITVAAHHRVLSKYSAFAYRLINLDAGVALGQLHMVGNSLGLRTRTIRRWADDIIDERLDLESVNEGVTGAMLVLENRDSRL